MILFLTNRYHFHKIINKLIINILIINIFIIEGPGMSREKGRAIL